MTKPKKAADGHLGEQLNVRLTGAAAARAARLAEAHGGKKPMVQAAMKALDAQGEPDPLELIARGLAILEARQKA